MKPSQSGQLAEACAVLCATSSYALLLAEAIEARGIDPIEVSPDHWHHVHNRMTIGETPRAYGFRQHRAFLLRREIGA